MEALGVKKTDDNVVCFYYFIYLFFIYCDPLT